MPVEEHADVDLGIDEKTLDDLDKKAAKAAQSLEKKNREETKSGINKSKLSKRDQVIEKKLKKLEEKIKKDEVRQIGNKKDTILDKIWGKKISGNIFAIGKNPISFMTGILKIIPILGGILAAKEIAEFIVDEIAKIDRFLKKFIDIIDNRIDAFRILQVQADIQAGLSQRILTTAYGTTEPRYSYNTFEEFNNNQSQHETEFQLTNNSGV